LASVPDSKSGGWGFESLQACFLVERIAMIKKLKSYIGEVNQELSKVSWPGRQELYGSTLIVVTLCAILSLFVFGVDILLNQLLNLLF
jgi:preprotein translocase subunit SecE